MPSTAPAIDWALATSFLLLALNIVVILVITSLSIWWDLERVNRPFPFLQIVCEPAFFTLVLIQSAIAFAFLVGLTYAGRASFHTVLDAVWVSVAGLSLLKTLPAPKSEDGQRLWGMADWLFQKFYLQLRLTISSISIKFKDQLKSRYATKPSEFLVHVRQLLDTVEAADRAATEYQKLEVQLAASPDDAAKVQLLADYVAPRTKLSDWQRLNGN